MTKGISTIYTLAADVATFIPSAIGASKNSTVAQWLNSPTPKGLAFCSALNALSIATANMLGKAHETTSSMIQVGLATAGFVAGIALAKPLGSLIGVTITPYLAAQIAAMNLVTKVATYGVYQLVKKASDASRTPEESTPQKEPAPKKPVEPKKVAEMTLPTEPAPAEASGMSDTAKKATTVVALIFTVIAASIAGAYYVSSQPTLNYNDNLQPECPATDLEICLPSDVPGTALMATDRKIKDYQLFDASPLKALREELSTISTAHPPKSPTMTFIPSDDTIWVDSNGTAFATCPREERDLPESTQTQMTREQIRESYNRAVDLAKAEAEKIFEEFEANEMCVGEPVAREFTALRDKIKCDHQLESPWYDRAAIQARQIWKYHVKPSANIKEMFTKCFDILCRGDANPTYDDLVALGKTSEEIAHSAFKTGGGDLGLKNNQ